MTIPNLICSLDGKGLKGTDGAYRLLLGKETGHKLPDMSLPGYSQRSAEQS